MYRVLIRDENHLRAVAAEDVYFDEDVNVVSADNKMITATGLCISYAGNDDPNYLIPMYESAANNYLRELVTSGYLDLSSYSKVVYPVTADEDEDIIVSFQT